MEWTAFVLCGALTYFRKSCTEQVHIQMQCHDPVAFFCKFSQTAFETELTVCLSTNVQRISFAPNVGLEPTTLRLRVSCSTD